MGGTVKLAIVAGLGTVTIGVLAAARNMHEPQTPPTAAAAAKQPSKPAAASDPDDPKQAGHFAGRVIGPDGEPVAGAKLFITQNESPPTEIGPVRASSGVDGRFEFAAADMTYVGIDGLPTRQMGLLIATADQYQPAWVTTWGHGRGRRAHLRSDAVKGADLTLRMARVDVPIHGRLLDPNGQPLAGARVRLCSLKVPPEGEFDADLKRFKDAKDHGWPFNYNQSVHEPIVLPGVATEAITDADGRFLLAGLGRDRLAELKITAPGVVDTYLTVMTRDAPDLKFANNAVLGRRASRCVSNQAALSGESCATARRERRLPECG